MILKRKSGKQILKEARARNVLGYASLMRGDHEGTSPEQRGVNMGTAQRVKEVLAQLTQKGYTVLCRIPSSSAAKKGQLVYHDIRMGSNHAVFCTCKGWQYSKTGTCPHLERFKNEIKPQTLL